MKPLVSLIFFFLLGIPAFGQVKISNSTDWWRTPQARQAHALKLHRDFEVLYNQIPTLSPSEEQWLKTEYDDTIAASGGRYTKRAVDAMATRAWSIRIGKAPRIPKLTLNLPCSADRSILHTKRGIGLSSQRC